jgi:hypothetical protein
LWPKPVLSAAAVSSNQQRNDDVCRSTSRWCSTGVQARLVNIFSGSERGNQHVSLIL